MLLAGQIGLSAGNFLVGASIGLRPMDLQIMLTVANLIGLPIGIFRSWYYDNHHIPGGKFLFFIKRTGFPIVLISMIFVWLPYEYFNYTTKNGVVVACADARFFTGADNPNRIDKVVRRSMD